MYVKKRKEKKKIIMNLKMLILFGKILNLCSITCLKIDVDSDFSPLVNYVG